MKILQFFRNLLKYIISIPKRLIDLTKSFVVELRRVEWLSLGDLSKSIALVLFYATIIGVILYLVDIFFEFLILDKLFNLGK